MRSHRPNGTSSSRARPLRKTRRSIPAEKINTIYSKLLTAKNRSSTILMLCPVPVMKRSGSPRPNAPRLSATGPDRSWLVKRATWKRPNFHQAALTGHLSSPLAPNDVARRDHSLDRLGWSHSLSYLEASWACLRAASPRLPRYFCNPNETLGQLWLSHRTGERIFLTAKMHACNQTVTGTQGTRTAKITTARELTPNARPRTLGKGDRIGWSRAEDGVHRFSPAHTMGCPSTPN